MHIDETSKEAVDISEDINSTKYYFSKESKQNVYLDNNAIYYKGEKVIDCSEIKLKGIHNYENIMAVISAVKVYDVDNESICKVLRTFGGVEHRIEFVRELNGRKFYNDSKSTNNVATITALNSFNEPTILIMGCLDRNIPFDEISPYLKNVKYIITF